jgi:hypothetical protein
MNFDLKVARPFFRLTLLAIPVEFTYVNKKKMI